MNGSIKTTDIRDPEYFHKVVDCQYACPAHTPVPEYIRLIAARRYDDAYMVNWKSNVFPGILGRTCDRPCEPACRRADSDGAIAIRNLKRYVLDSLGPGFALPPVAVTRAIATAWAVSSVHSPGAKPPVSTVTVITS